MKNFYLNWMKNAAKNTQTTGGGTSRRYEDANQSRIASDPIPCRYRVESFSVDLCSPHVFPFRSQKSIGFSTLPCFGYTPGISGRLMKYAAMMALLLTLACGQVWGTGTQVTFTANATSGQRGYVNSYDVDTLIRGQVTLKLDSLGSATAVSQIYNSNKDTKEPAWKLSTSAANNANKNYIELKASSGYNITGIQIRTAATGTTASRIIAVCFASAFSMTDNSVLDTISIPLLSNANNNSASHNITLSGIPSGTGCVRIYKAVRYDGTNKKLVNSGGTQIWAASSAPTAVIPWIKVTYEAAAAACESYSFHCGKSGQSGWEISCFEYSGAGAVYYVEDFTIPAAATATHYYVGNQGVFYNSNLGYGWGEGNGPSRSHEDTWGDLHFAASQGDGSGTRPKVGQATGATGTIRVYDNSTWNNMFVSFIPDGYKLKFGSTEKDFTLISGNEYLSDLVEYSSSNARDNVSVGIIDSDGDYVATDNTQEMQHLFLKVSSDWASSSAKFSIYDIGAKAFKDGFMTLVPGETDLYEGWVSSSCTSVIFVRHNSSATSPSFDSGNKWNQTGNLDLESGKNYFTINQGTWDGQTTGWSAYSKKGKFRMWDNSTAKNWYVRFVPNYVLTYDKNNAGASGTMEEQGVAVDAASKSVSVLANGFTPPTGYTFNTWKTGPSTGTSYAPNASYTLSADATLYAQWSPKQCTVTFDNNGGTGTITSVTATYDAAMPTKAGNLPTKTGYTFAGFFDGEGGTGNQYYKADGTSYTNWDKNTTSTTTLYAKWTINSYDLTWDLDGGTTTSAGTGIASGVSVNTTTSQNYSTSLTAPTVTKSGYQFTGWDVTPASTMPAANTTYTAQWAQLYDVAKGAHFDGDITISPTSAVSGATVTITATPDDGYALDAWTIKKTSDGSDVTASVSLSGQTATATFTMPAYGVTVDAAFEEDITTYSVTYADGGKDGGGAAPSDATAYSPNAEVTVLGNVNSMTKTGCTFRGWSDGTTFYLAGQKFNINSDVTLTAVWDGGTSCTTLAQATQKSDHTAMNTATVGTVTNNGSMNAEDNYIKLDASANFQVTAKTGYTPIAAGDKLTVTVYNKGNSAANRGFKLKSKNAETSHTSSIAATSTGNVVYTLVADDIENDGTIKIFRTDGNDRYDAILLERCTKFNFTVSFNMKSHGEAVSSYVGVPTGKKILQPTAPTAVGYIFGGWYTDSSCTSAWNWGSSTVSKDTTLYAKWTAKTQPTQYTVSIDAATVCSGSSTNIKMASSQSGVSYQLYKGEDKVGDAKDGGSALTWSSNSTTGTYKVMAVENATYAAREMSNTVSLANYDAVSIKTHPTEEIAATVDVGSDMSVELNTGTFNNATYTWQTCTDATPSSASDISSGSQYANYNTATMTFTPAAEGTYYFRCKVTDDCGTTVYSNVATVTASVAKEDPTVYTLSGTTSVCEGDEATLTLDGSDDGVTYALYLDGVDQSDDKVGDGNEITWTVTADGTYTVSAKADATYNAADMDGSAVISYKTATAIGTQPTTAVSGHDGVDFTLGSDLAATGEGTLTYQWYSYTSAEGAGQATVGSATTTKTLTTSKAAGTYYYKVEVIGECGRVKSEMITVTVDNKHRITYDANNGSGAPSGNWKSPVAMTLPADLPTRSGYIFLGWNTKDDGTGDMYQPGGSFTMPATATTLWAAWASPCFTFSKGTKGTEPTDGFVMTPSNINSSAFKDGATLSGGNMTNTSGATLGINSSYGFVMKKSTRELTLTLTGGQFQAGTVIELEGTTNKASDSKTYGFSISGNALTSLKTVDNSNTAFSQRYVVTASDGVEGEESCTITMNADASGSQTYLSAIKIGGCMACTSIHPTLTYSKTTIWMDDESLTASPTLNKDGSTSSVTYVSGNTAVATVNESTGVVTAVARGTATITATIAADGTHCEKSVSCNITVKDMECGENVIIEAVRKSGTKTEASHDGILYGSSAINTYDNGKLGVTGNYFGLTLKSGYYFQDGDKLYVKLNTINENGDGIVVTSGLDGSGDVIGTLANASQSTDYSNEITLSNVPASTSSIVIYRTASVTQNPYIDAMKVKRYVCPDSYVYDDAAGNGSWSDEDNWIGPAGHGAGLPTIEDRAVITKPITVDIAHATAAEVRLDQSSTNTGELTIQANKGLEVVGMIRKTTDGSSYGPTTPADLLLESDATGNATLIFDNSNSDQATVQMYSKGWTTGEQGGGTWNWQTVGVPVTDATRMNDYYGGYMYEWSGGWVDKTDMYGALTPFTAYSVSYPTGDAEHLHTYSIDGTLVPTGDKSISIPANTSVMALANSWTAPIHISDIEFTSEPANIFLYNTGYNYESAATKADSRYAPGTYLCIPKNSAPYLDESYIAPMQGFYVKNKLNSAGTITINYNTVVRPSSDRAIVSGAMHAPKREISHLSEPAVLKMYVSDTQHDDRLVLLEREDFSRGFDNGWDGEKFQINAVKTAPRIFAINETGGKESVSAIPELENTVIGFRPGKEETYTIRFEYNGDETLYLRDTRTGAETLITNESEYIFLSDGTNEDARFIIVRVQSTPTGTEEIGAGSKAYKLMIEDHIYIIRDGRMYSVDGALVNLERK